MKSVDFGGSSVLPLFSYGDLRLYFQDSDKREDKTRGLPVVFVHGAGSSRRTWHLQTEAFESMHRVIAPDLSGHGESDAGPDDVSIEEFASELAALVEHLDLRDFVLVGHSMGGGVAMAYTLNKEYRRPLAITLVDTAPDLELSKLATGLAIETLETQLYLFKERKEQGKNGPYDIIRNEEDTKRKNPRITSRDLAAADKFNVTKRVGEIDVPVFVIVGEKDNIVTPAMAKKFEESLPRADIAVVKKADHVPMLQNPEDFNAILRKFLEWVEEKCKK
ncbi:MAG: alpha/beta fold hydrolase [Candidatus Thorarchaeota archaeon]|jgi:pimeloyl-ACP methyl ester carboxylesterase